MLGTRGVRALGLAVLASVPLAACSDEKTADIARETSTLGASNDHTVLILGTTVSGGSSSREAFYAAAAGYTVEVVTAAGWAAKSAADFASYRALILGDPTCGGGTAAIAPAVNNRTVWGPVVNGNVIIDGTDPVFHQGQGGNKVTQGAVQFAAAEPGLTGAYISLSCYYNSATANTPVPLLEPFQSAATGTFTVRSAGCHNAAHKVADHPALAGITDAALSNWGCSVHEFFDHFPSNFLPLAIALGNLGAGTVTFADGTSGIPYIVARGRTLVPPNCGDGKLQAPFEQCDDGNTDNCDGCSAQCKIESPVCGNGTLDCDEDCDDGDTSSGDGCSSTCTSEICGNGILDPGEQCDDGNTSPGDGCSPTCLSEARPPEARCADRTVIASSTCSASADVNAGSSDPDGNLAGCTQTPAGYLGVGTHPVTLTCTDTTGLDASCAATVTVVDETPPSIACPADMRFYTSIGNAVVSYPAPTTGDNCGALPVHCSIPAGSTLALGDHSITCQVQDGSGLTSTCSFNVHVETGCCSSHEPFCTY